MERAKRSDATLSVARDYFADELRVALRKQQVSTQNDSFEYIVNLLVQFLQTENFFDKDDAGKFKNHFLLELYSNYLTGDAQTKAVSLRRLGDVCLLVTGFFPDSLNRKLVDVDYYHGMGGTAYWQLSQIQFSGTSKSLFQELSTKFRTFSDVLGEVSTRSGLQSNVDLMRLYEKWLMTGSERLKAMLKEQGIASPFPVDLKVRH